MTPDPDELLRLALAAALEAGRVLRDERPADLGVAATKSSPTDIVTEMDRRAEQLLVAHLLGARPDDAVLGEEGGAESGTTGVRWVLDPIDGTVNYLYGLPAWAVSVAAEVDGESLVGVVHAPAMGLTYSAVRGAGAHLDGQPLHVNSGVALDRALVATGFGYEAAGRARQGEVAGALVGRVRDLRRWGSASLDLCSVAAGHVDAYYERYTNRWDIAAGGLVASEAGARVGGLRGSAASPDLVLAAAPDLFGPLHDLLVDLRADED